MTDAVIVSTARTPIGKAYKGALNNTEGATLLGHAISAALSRANVEGAEVEDVVMGCAMQQGTTGTNIARKALLRAGLPVSVAGTTIDRQCASGLQLGIFRGFVAAGCEPDEMGVGPVYAVPRLLKRHGLKIDDIDL